MRKLVVVWRLLVCLGVAVLWSVASVSFGVSAAGETFALAERVGEGNERSFFVLSTSAGNYVIRHDGMGEFTSPAGLRRVFTLKLRGRIDRVYFIEHQRDLFLMYEGHDASSQWAYLERMEQTKRKARWITSIDNSELGAPVIQGEFVVIKDIEISKTTGALMKD
jgi:hypothetical protein